MATLHLLGTGAAVSDPHRTTTMLAFEQPDALVLVDCGGDLLQRLMQAGIPYRDVARIEALILTHEHPDHIGGFPLFMEKIWLAQRRDPLPVYGIRRALDHARRLMAQFDTSAWEGMPRIEWHEFPLEEGVTVLESAAWRILAAPVQHSVPNVGLRVEDQRGGGVVAYSCDTAACAAVTRLARGVAILVHEATGAGPGHSSAPDAARAAQEAGAARLLLAHIPPEEFLGDEQMAAARALFPATEKGEEGGRYEF